MRTNEMVDHQAEMMRILEQLQPDALNRRMKELRRGGLTTPASEGRRGAHAAEPHSDPFDRQIRHDSLEYVRHIVLALRSLRAAWLIESSYLDVTHDVDPELTARPCQNIHCTLLLDRGLQSGECNRCRVHRSRHGLPWPYENAIAK